MVDGIMSDVFSMSTLPLSQPELSAEIKEKIRAQSRQRYATERGKLEELIKIWSNKTFSPVEKAMQKAMESAENEGGPAVAPAVDNSASIPDADDMERRKQEQAKTATPTAAATPSAPASQPAQPQPQTSGFDSSVSINEVGVPMVKKTTFTINDIKIGDWYDGFVKLKYNY